MQLPNFAQSFSVIMLSFLSDFPQLKECMKIFFLVDSDHLLMSNRSHAYYKLGDYEAALEDADRAIKARPDWGKGYFRKGKALLALGEIIRLIIAVLVVPLKL